MESNQTSMTNGYFVVSGFSVSDGEYDLKINTTTDSSSETVTGIFRDTVSPNKADSKSPTSKISNDEPTVDISVSDDLSGVDYTFLNVSDSDGDDVDSVKGESIDLSDLSDEQYTVDYKIKDNAGNQRTSDWTFTVDTTYDGDTSPSLNWESGEDDGIILMNDDETLTLGFDDEDEEPDTVTCYEDYDDSDDKGEEIDSDEDPDTNDNEYQFECDFDEDDYSGDEVDLTIEFCDEAGNCDTYEPDNSPFVFDASGPDVAELDTDVTTINDDFELDYTATDESGIDEVEYFFDEDTDVGEGTEVSDPSEEGTFTVDVSSLDAGENTVYVRAMDGAGRWSSSVSLTFDYVPNADPQVSLTVPDSMTVSAGDSENFDVMVENTGELLIENVNISVSGEVASGTESIDDLFPSESINVSFEVIAEEDDIGTQSVDIDSESPSASDSFDVRVEANQNQRTEIESKLSEYQTKMNELSERAESQREEIRSNLYSRYESNFTEFKSKVESAQQQVDNGQYYMAQSSLEDIESSYSSADSSFNEVVEIDNRKDRNQMIMFAVLGLLVLTGSAGGFVWYSDDYGLNLERLADSDIDVRGFDDLKARIDSIFSSEDEAEEFEWNGFR